MAKLTDLITPVATRARSLDFTALGLWLPNPDPILKAQGKDIAVYRDLRADAHVGGCIRRRKSAVKALQWGLDRDKAPSRVHKAVEAILANLDMERLIGDCLEAVMYGYQPLEVIWQRDGAQLVPGEIRALPPEWFCFDPEGALRFKTRANPMTGEELPPQKFLLPRQDASYASPYGFADLSMVFWPMVFKKGGTKFWLAFTEKYGMPFLMGKAEGDDAMESMRGELDRMIADAVAVVPVGSEVSLLEGKSGAASADLYEKLVLHCRSEVSIALLGSNMGMEKDSNRATAGAGLDVAEDLRDGDAEIVAAAVNQLIRWICEINFGTAAAPVWSLWDQEAKDTLRAGRDKLLTESGARLTNAYWMREYELEAEDLLPQDAPPLLPQPPWGVAPQPLPNPPIEGAGAAAAHALSPLTRREADTAHALSPLTRGAGGVALGADRLAADCQPHIDTWIGQISTMLDAAGSLEEFRASLLAAYPGLDSAGVVAAMRQALTAAELQGRFDVRREAPTAPPVINNYITVPETVVNIVNEAAHAAQAPAADPPVVNVVVQSPVVHVAAPNVSVTNEVQPAPINTVVTHPSQAIQTVERDPKTLEIVRTITDYKE